MINGRCDHSKFVSPNIHPSPMKAILISTVWWSRPSCLFLDDRAALLKERVHRRGGHDEWNGSGATRLNKPSEAAGTVCHTKILGANSKTVAESSRIHRKLDDQKRTEPRKRIYATRGDFPNDVMCLVFVLQCGGCTTDEADIAPRAETI
uniref:Uncharacterized protein n=1 Tax=Globodera rostochiensis TaxID=31243 RepID=A0A914HDB5_GLORO